MSQKLNNFHRKYFSELAVSLAKINMYITGENPSVGCVVTNFSNEILSTGCTSARGRPHAEYNALVKLDNKSKKRVFVTLEPCNHFGKTPPCTSIIKKKNVKEVYCASEDHNPIVKNKGFNFLNKNKILVVRKKITNQKLNNKYTYSVTTKKPYVTAKLALTKNFSTIWKGKKYFTNSDSLKFSHLLRYTNDSILVGKNTFLKDFPKLNCRLPGLFQFTPKIFIINGNLTIKPKHLRLYTKKTTIFHSCEDTKKISKYKKCFHLEKIKTTSGIISPNEILSRIYSLGSRRLLVEGGLKTLKLFEKSNLVNKYLLIRSNLNAPKVLSSAKSLIWSLCANNLSRSKVDINLSNDELFSI